jgi:hypothetical protein
MKNINLLLIIIEYNILINNLCFVKNSKTNYDFAHFVYEWLKLKNKWNLPLTENDIKEESDMIYWKNYE